MRGVSDVVGVEFVAGWVFTEVWCVQMCVCWGGVYMNVRNKPEQQ